MEYDKFIAGVLTKTLHSDTVQSVNLFLQNMYLALGSDLSALKKEMKEAGYVVPHFITDYITNLPIIKKSARKILIDHKVSYTALNSYGIAAAGYTRVTHVGGTDYLYEYLKDTDDLITIQYEAPDTGQSWNLYAWIARGSICDCGNHFINQGYDECLICRGSDQALEFNAKAEELLEIEDTKEHLFGIELEYEGVKAKHVKKTIPLHAIAKRDGTISNGVEVVTRPACIQTHKRAMKPFFDAVKTNKAPNTGMHVHIDKKNISQIQVGFMLWFLNNKDNYNFLFKIAGRDFKDNTYTRPNTSLNITSHLFYDETTRKLRRDSTTKYMPFRLNKQNTYEIRIFSSPESHLEMSAKLDFVKALLDYSSPYAIHVKSLKDKVKYENFMEFVTSNKKHYPDFISFYGGIL